MGRIKFITGGARSGKSRLAESFLKNEDNVIYIATGIAFDNEMKDRIAKHRETRNSNWITVEAYKSLDSKLKNITGGMDYILLDCVTIMVSNLMLLENDVDWDNAGIEMVNSIERNILQEINKFLDIVRGFSGETIIVSNELGMGIVPPTPLGRYYRDIAGRANQVIADLADEVYFVVSGIPMRIKG